MSGQATPANSTETPIQRFLGVGACLGMFLVLLLMLVYGVWYLVTGNPSAILRWTIVSLCLAICLWGCIETIRAWWQGKSNWKDFGAGIWGFFIMAVFWAQSSADRDKTPPPKALTTEERFSDHEQRLKELERQVEELKKGKE